MDYNILENLQYCGAIVEDLLSFLYYTHIPPTAVALLLGIYVFVKNRENPSSKWLLALSVVFALWTTVDLFLWIAYDQATIIMTLWSSIGILSSLLFILTYLFIFTFVTGRKVPGWLWIIAFVLLLPVIIASPTIYNLEGFDIRDCVALEAPWFLYYYHGLGVLAALALPFIPLFKKAEAGTGASHNIPRAATILAIIGAELFIITFLVTGFLSSYLVEAGIVSDFGLEQYGIVTMAVFMAILAYLIVQYHAFNIQVLAAQALMVGLVILVASEYLYTTNFGLTTTTLAIAVFFGIALVRSVSKQVELGKNLEAANARLQDINTKLDQANEHLKELDQMKSEFLSIASHQLRAPITAVRGYAANIIDGTYGAVPAHLAEPLETVQESARMMANSIEDYLNISRIEQNRMKYEKSEFDIRALSKKVVAELAPVAKKKKLTLSANGGEDPLQVTADVGKIKQVITNLVDNSIKYTEKGSIEVAVTKEGKMARVTIADTGIGIAPEELSGLFEKFKRARGANKVNTTGTGLGLYVAKQLIEGHNGKIWAESEGRDKGSKFIIELPA